MFQKAKKVYYIGMATIYDYLGNEEDFKKGVERFDTLFSEASAQARDEVMRDIKKMMLNKSGISEGVAKFVYARLHDYLNMSPIEQKQAHNHGVWLVSLQ